LKETKIYYFNLKEMKGAQKKILPKVVMFFLPQYKFKGLQVSTFPG
jgi:hypothetical protein